MGTTELIIVLAIVLLIFGATRLPGWPDRSVGPRTHSRPDWPIRPSLETAWGTRESRHSPARSLLADVDEVGEVAPTAPMVIGLPPAGDGSGVLAANRS